MPTVLKAIRPSLGESLAPYFFAVSAVGSSWFFWTLTSAKARFEAKNGHDEHH